MIARDLTDQTEIVRAGNDIVDVVSSYVTLRRSGRNFKALCPFHNEKTPSFHVYPDKQIFKCFGCGQGGDVFRFVQLKEGLEFPDAKEMLARRAGVSLENNERRTASSRKSDEPGKSDLERANRWACQWFRKQLWESPEAESAREYLVSRGINEQSAERFAIGFAPPGWESLRNAAASAKAPVEFLVAAGLLKRRQDGTTYDAFRNRLMFPIVDAMNRIVGFGGRALDDDPAKYVNSPQSALFDKSRCLYGLNTAKEAFSTTRVAIVVEGYIDCILCQQHGFAHAVATLGTALTPEHAQLLRRYVDSVTLVFDSDEAGRRAADRSLGVFVSQRLDVRLSNVPKGKDPADLLVSEGAIAFEAVLTSAVDALEFKWNQVKNRYLNAQSGMDRANAIEEYLTLVASSTDFGAIDPIQQGLILNQVGKLLGLSGEEVRRQLRIVSRRSAGSHGVADELDKRPERARDEATAVMREIVSVLLNAPHLYAQAAPVFDSNVISDSALREIAGAMKSMATSGAPFSVAQLLSRFESGEMSRCITDLQLEGERRGDYVRTMAIGLSRLAAIRESSERDRLLSELRTGHREGQSNVEGAKSNDSIGAGALQAAARAMADVSRRANHFAPLKYLAAPPMKGAD